MILTIASGKGGTGKTTLAVNLAHALASREAAKPSSRRKGVQLLDCDVEEPNAHLFVNPDFTLREEVRAPKPVWNPELCISCGKCAQACHYNAIAMVKGKVLIFNELCHSCGVCSYVCPVNALTEVRTKIGKVETAAGNKPFAFAHGVLDIGEALAPTVVGAVKRHIAANTINIIDASPGTACPVVEAVDGSDAVLLVTEPTPFGLNDLRLAAALTLRLKVPTGIVVNRSDGEDRIIAEFSRETGIPIAGRIPFRREYAESYSAGEILAERFPELRENLLDIFDNLKTALPQPPEIRDFPEPAPAEPPRKDGAASVFREIVVLSGKGGTGKTTVLASLACLAEDKVLADNDVDAADLHLLITPTIREAHDFEGGHSYSVDPARCIGCGSCMEKCHFNAIRHDGPASDLIATTYRIEALACEGCGLCKLVCPSDAISGHPTITGRWYVSDTEYGIMSHARLGVAEENSGRLVTRVRQRAAELARERGHSLILGDGPPGTACPVIAAVTNADMALLVTEPTVSGVHDLERLMRLLKHFGVPAGIVINKADLNAEQAKRIESLAEENDAAIIGRIPFDPSVQEALRERKTLVEYGKGPAYEAVKEVWSELRRTYERY